MRKLIRYLWEFATGVNQSEPGQAPDNTLNTIVSGSRINIIFHNLESINW